MSDLVLVVTAEGGVHRPLISGLEHEFGTRACWLNAEAVEVPLGIHRPDLAALRAGARVDFNILPARRPVPRLFIADMDSTIIGVECIDELADIAGVKQEVAAVTEAAMRGEMDFEQAIHARVGKLKGLPLSALQECYDMRVRLNAGAEALLCGMKRHGAHAALVSGGFTFFSERVAAAAGFDENRANRLEDDGAHLTGKVIPPILGQAAKAERLAAICAEKGITADEVVAIGDGANDLAMIRAAGLGIAYRAKPALRAEADAVLDHSDLSAVLALAGIADAPGVEG